MISGFKSLLAKISHKGKAPETEKSATTEPPAISQPIGPMNAAAELEDAERTKERGWIGVDLDGTLAYYEGWRGLDYIGKPIPGIRARVLEWIEQGYRVKVFTARASVPEGVEPIKNWLAENGFPELEITSSKDFHMIELWDDRAIQVVTNSGSPILSARWGAQPRAPLFGLEKKYGGKDSESA